MILPAKTVCIIQKSASYPLEIFVSCSFFALHDSLEAHLTLSFREHQRTKNREVQNFLIRHPDFLQQHRKIRILSGGHEHFTFRHR